MTEIHADGIWSVQLLRTMKELCKDLILSAGSPLDFLLAGAKREANQRDKIGLGVNQRDTIGNGGSMPRRGS